MYMRTRWVKLVDNRLSVSEIANNWPAAAADNQTFTLFHAFDND